MNKGKLFLTGGGSSDDERPILEMFLNSLLSNDILYVPLALTQDKYESAHEWISNSLDPIKSDLNITMVSDPYNLENLNCGGIFIGGGDTNRLISLLEHSGLGQKIINQHMKGVPIYGGSAGAILCGKSALMSQEFIEQNNMNGLSLIWDISCCCHYTESDSNRIEAAEYNGRILCMPEDSGVMVENGVALSSGKGPVLLYSKNKYEIYKPGEFFVI